jgi:hypothetical protein
MTGGHHSAEAVDIIATPGAAPHKRGVVVVVSDTIPTGGRERHDTDGGGAMILQDG